ncbi:hypothetical protein [Dokdonia sp. Asnod3-C12]|uniref:hypothetical protein n=1 Tax=Dokdonia sp. Asnod3-C12 TaxID=3160575 RepID=UPI0038692165
MKIEQNLLEEIENDLTLEIVKNRDYILEKIRVILKRDRYTFQMFNGKVGGKNNIYVDSVMTQFSDFNDFYSQWLKGVRNDYEKRTKYGSIEGHNAQLLKEPKLEKYIRIFLERNFYRNLKERTRLKPNVELWKVWFGYNVIFGLLIAPKREEGTWIIDKSEIRRADYSYWTIGHVFKEGLIDNSLSKPFYIYNLEQFESIYLSIFQQLSNSVYEKQICEKYIEYLRQSENLESEPFLIPEVRYLGLEKKHLYRLDFTILNSHTQEYIGFEISPASSHMSVKGLKEKQKIVNEELSKKWHKEMQKRNDYFELYDITTITLTEHDFQDIDSCWSLFEKYLSSRSEDKTSVQSELKRISNI